MVAEKNRLNEMVLTFFLLIYLFIYYLFIHIHAFIHIFIIHVQVFHMLKYFFNVEKLAIYMLLSRR